MRMVQILTILPVGIENLEKLAQIAGISCSSGKGRQIERSLHSLLELLTNTNGDTKF